MGSRQLSVRIPSTANEANVDRQSDLDNHANQLNPNNDAYWQSRDEDERPDDWEEQVQDDDKAQRDKDSGRRK